jgi:hypothetical protein
MQQIADWLEKRFDRAASSRTKLKEKGHRRGQRIKNFALQHAIGVVGRAL